MVDRVFIGDHPIYGMGLYVSQPTIDVKTASKFQMSWSTIFEQFQILSSGSIAIDGGDALNPSWSATFSWTNLGYKPVVFLSAEKYPMVFEYLSDSSARVRRASYDEIEAYPEDSEDGDTTCYYYVTRTAFP